MTSHKILQTTIIYLSFRADKSEQTVKTEIRLVLEEQSKQELHCLHFCVHLLVAFLCDRTFLSFRVIATNFEDIQKLRKISMLLK